MTDNRTTELQSLSKLKYAGKLKYWRGIIEIREDDLHAICDEIQAEHERAIAATLGNVNNGRTRWHELFGTPERAAQTLAGKCCDCCECVLFNVVGRSCVEHCIAIDYDTLLEWLESEVRDD